MPESSGTVIFAGNDASDELTVLDVLDHVLNAGVVIRGNLIISLAGVDLVYVGLDVLLTSVETALKHMGMSSLAAPAENASRQKRQ
jgi:hypothetical protein